MASSHDVFPPDDRCEICGAVLDEEVVIQEFADGSMARLCAECAAGTALEPVEYPTSDREVESSLPSADSDPLAVTKELLTPVVDLIGLQREMQAALERLASSLERFAAGVLTDNLDKTALVEDRVQALEQELEQTRARLREAEHMLSAARVASEDAGEAAVTEATGEQASVTTEVPSTADAASGPEESAAAAGAPIVAPPAETVSVTAPVSGTAASHPEEGEPHGFRLEEVQAVQRYFNDSPFTAKIRDVRQSLGRPKANVTRAAGAEPRAFVTVTWDIVWYQYLVDLRRDIPSDERVILDREGMNLDELADQFKEKNASMGDDGRLDASELEVRLLSDPSALITEMTVDEERALEDATEEIWDQRVSPEFKWDD